MLKGTLCIKPNQARPQSISQTQWKCPPEFIVDSNWCVAAGEESTEAVTQTHVDPDPRPYAEVQEDCDYSDSRTPVIPMIPIEEEGNLLNNSSAPLFTTSAMNGETMSLAISALNALNGVALHQGEPPIDMGLFMQWLNNSDTVRQYLSGRSVPGINPASILNEPTHSVPFVSSLMNPSSLSGNTQVVRLGQPRLKPPQKLCIFFNTLKGCRYGASGQYLHSKSDQALQSGVEAFSNAKRMKPGSETSGSLYK